MFKTKAQITQKNQILSINNSYINMKIFFK